MLRVAVVCSGLGRVRRGFERFAAELGEALRGEVHLGVFGGRIPRDLPGGSLPCLPRKWGARLGLSSERAYYVEQATFALSLVPALYAFRPDIVHVSDPALANALVRLKGRHTHRARIVFCNGGRLSPEHYRKYDHVQLVGRWQAPEARSAGVPDGQVSVVPLGLRPSAFAAPPGPQSERRRRLGLPDGVPLAIAVSALDRRVKRLDLAIETLALPEARAWHLICLGEPTSETDELKRLAARRAPSRVTFRTVMPAEVSPFLGAADLFVHPARTEGFGLAVLEAMAAGLPIVAAGLPALAELLDDPSQLESAVTPENLWLHFARAEREEHQRAIGARNRARALAYRWPSLIPRYLEMYERALAAR